MTERARGSAGCGLAPLFRVTRWVDLAGDLDRLRYRRAMAAMSVGPVDRHWLITEGGLRRGEADALLVALRQEGALEVLSTSLPLPIDAREPSSGFRHGFMRRVRRWLHADAPLLQERVPTGTP